MSKEKRKYIHFIEDIDTIKENIPDLKKHIKKVLKTEKKIEKE